MPILSDSNVTFQWLRELKRWHKLRMAAAIFQVPDNLEVWVGHFGEVHHLMPACQASFWISQNPNGTQMVISGSISKSDLLEIKELDQRLGWTQHPDPGISCRDCVCPACLPSGLPDLFRRLRACYYHWIARLREATDPDEVVQALGNMEPALERAGKRLSPKRILNLAKSPVPSIRRSLAGLLVWFRWREVESVVEELLQDQEESVQLEALRTKWQQLGSYEVARQMSNHPLALGLLELLEWENDQGVLERALQIFLVSDILEVRQEAAQRRLESLHSG